MFRKSSYTQKEFHNGQHRFEHWYRDNTSYFITSRVADQSAAFGSETGKQIFWDRFWRYARRYEFEPWVTSLLDNHYHLFGYMRSGENLGPFTQHLHGSVAKLVNDLLPTRITPFWRNKGNKDYFDGCLRDELQLRRAYRYVCQQAVRAGIVADYHDYPHTMIDVDLETSLKRARDRKVYLANVPYARYQRRGRLSDHAT